MKFLVVIAVLVLLAASYFVATTMNKSGPRDQTIAVAVTNDGFEPANIRVKANRPVQLVVTRKVESTCATDIVLADLGIRKPLPLNQPVEIRFIPKKPGSIRYACGMDMIAGELIVQ